MFLSLLTACTPPCTTASPPIMVLSAAELDFGAMPWPESAERTVILSNQGGTPLGIYAIAATGDFTVAWDACSVECDGDEAAAAKGDTGWEDTDPPAGDTGHSCEGPGSTLVVLRPGCQLPLTVEYSAGGLGMSEGVLRVQSVDATEDLDGERAYRADPVNSEAYTWLTGTSDGSPFVAVIPRSIDLGEVYPGTVAVAETAISNLGVAPATLIDVRLNEACSSDYLLTTIPSPGLVLEPGDEVPVEVQFAPTSAAVARCVLTVESEYAFDIGVTMTANDASSNTPPTVSVLSPAPGEDTSIATGLALVLAVADAEQPTSSLTCAVVGTTCSTAVDCAAPDDSGTVAVAIPGSELCAGADTLRVYVTDVRGEVAAAAVPIRVDTAQSELDADGDAVDAPGDCDDADAGTWPWATELADGVDNDCDGVVDEGTDVSDDDGDGWSEAAGDCDDDDDNSYPGADERGDAADNNCNGVVDEDTLLYDDDGDGYSEVHQDCDDEDPAMHPGAFDGCDELDNNCDLLRDDLPECQGLQIVGDLLVFEATTVNERETVSVLAHVVNADPGSLVITWFSNPEIVFDATFADGVAQATFTAPRVETGDEQALAVALHVEDVSGEAEVWTMMTVVDIDAAEQAECPASESTGCTTVTGPGWLGLLGLCLVRRRDRMARCGSPP